MQDDFELQEAIRQSRMSGAGNRLSASSGGQPAPSISVASTRVDSAGQIRRVWLMGDPWTRDFYFLEGDLDATPATS